MNKRRKFLKTAGAPVVFSMFGVSIIQACSKDDNADTSSVNSNNSSNNGPSSNNSLTNNSSTNNSSNTNTGQSNSSGLKIDLNNSQFSNLTEEGGWMNYTEQGLLLLRVSANEIRAFSNTCPHQGAKNSWSYNNSRFRCARHGRSFGDTCSGGLMCYTTSIEGNILSISI